MANRPTIAKILQVDDEWLPGIYNYSVTLEDIDAESTTRSEDGVMHREITRKNVYHANITHYCTLDEVELVCAAVKAESTISVKAFCPGKDGNAAYSEFDAYVSKMTTNLIWYEDPEGDEECWWEISYQLVEV